MGATSAPKQCVYKHKRAAVGAAKVQEDDYWERCEYFLAKSTASAKNEKRKKKKVACKLVSGRVAGTRPSEPRAEDLAASVCRRCTLLHLIREKRKSSRCY